jgi:hypothetical protein
LNLAHTFEKQRKSAMPSLKFLSMAVLVGSVIAGVLLSYQWGQAAEPPLVKVTPASPEMMQLLRDEYGLVTEMLKVQNSRIN